MSSNAIGIDLGSAYSAAAYWDEASGAPRMVAGPDQEPLIPTAVALVEGSLVVGQQALSVAVSRRSDVATFFTSDLEVLGSAYQLGNRWLSPIELCSLVLGKLRINTEAVLRRPVESAVITVPTQALHTQRESIIEAAKLAGLRVLSLLAKPSAAAFGASLHQTDAEQTVLVCHLGASAFEAAILKCARGEVKILSSQPNCGVGGAGWDEVIAKWLCEQTGEPYPRAAVEAEQWGERTGLLPQGEETAQRRAKLLLEAEAAKRRLTTCNSVLVHVTSAGQQHEYELTQETLRQLLSAHLTRYEILCSIALKDAKTSWNDLTGVLLAGHCADTPILRERLAEKGVADRIIAAPPCESVVALGAATQAQRPPVSQPMPSSVPHRSAQGNAGLGMVKTVDAITVAHGSKEARIELCIGDITSLSINQASDVLVVSAFPNDYRPVRGSVMGALQRMGISVEDLAKAMEVDLREAFSCWMSRELTCAADVHFRRILCFEPYHHGTPAETIGDIFRSLAPFVGGHSPVRTVVTTLVASGDQMASPREVLVLLVEAAAHWMSAGLPLECLRIVCPRFRDTEELRHAFSDLRSRLSTRLPSEEKRYAYDIFVSYAHANTDEAMWFVSELRALASNLRLFVDRMELNAGAAWQREIYEALDNCSKVLTLYSPSYLASKVCLEEYNIALCRHRESDKAVLTPVYLYSAKLPTYMRLVQYSDCREFDKKKSRQAAAQFADTVSN